VGYPTQKKYGAAAFMGIPLHKNAFDPHQPLRFTHQTHQVPPQRRLKPPRARGGRRERRILLSHAARASHPLPLAVLALK